MITPRPTMVVLSSTLLLCSVVVAQAPDAVPPNAPPASAQQPKERKAIYDEKADAKQQIADALAKARRENRRVLIQWGANWCGWCHLLHELCAKDAGIKRELMYEYDVVLIDIGRFDKNMELAASYEADLKANGVPYLTVLDAEGKVLANQETGSLEKGKAHDPEKVMAFLKDHQAEYLSAESVLQDRMKRAKAESKIVFLHFGAPWCGWCHKLEDWMARPDIQTILAKDFVDVKIDEDRMTGGKEIEARYTGGEGQGIPWFAFIDPQSGTVIVTSEGASGNIGFPAAEDEIAHFREMLEKACKNISASDIDALVASLQKANPKPS